MATLECIEYGSTPKGAWPEWHQGIDYPGQVPWYVGVPTARGVKVNIGNIWSCIKVGHEKFPFLPGRSGRLLTGMEYTKASALPEIQFLEGLVSEDIEESTVATATELAEILTEIDSLAFQVEADEYGLVRPSYHAFKHCLKLVLMLARRGALVKPSSVSTDPNGAIRITWAADDRETEVVCPFEEAELPYVYHSSSDEYGTENDLSPEALMRRIHWAIGGE